MSLRRPLLVYYLYLILPGSNVKRSNPKHEDKLPSGGPRTTITRAIPLALANVNL